VYVILLHRDVICCTYDKASLIDIDLQVMRQLLMLNDQVEEMKWQRRQQQQRKALFSSTSTCVTPSIDDTDCSDTERRWSRSVAPNTPDSWSALPLDRPSRDDDDDDEEEATLKYPTPSALSLLRGGATRDDDQFSDSGSVDALDRSNPDTPDVFTATPQTTAGTRTTVARTSPPEKLIARTSRDGDEVVSKSTETIATERRSSTCDIDHKLPQSPTKKKEQEQEFHSTNTDSFHDFCTYVEMLI